VKIAINQKRISFGSQYSIFVNKKEKYFAETDAFTRNIIRLYEEDTGIKRHTIFKSLYFLKPAYKIEMPDGRRIKFKSMSFWGTHFKCLENENAYELYLHPKRKTSIYKNDTQIGFGEQEALTILAGDQYELRLNDDVNWELIICFFLIVDHLNSRNGGTIFTINAGPVFKQFKKFDPTWKPK
jgi:uncharacterized protein YxjI